MHVVAFLVLWAVLSAIGVLLLRQNAPYRRTARPSRASLHACREALLLLRGQGPLGISERERVTGWVAPALGGVSHFRFGLRDKVFKDSLIVCSGTLEAEAGGVRALYTPGIAALALVGAPMLISAFGTVAVAMIWHALSFHSVTLAGAALMPLLLAAGSAFLLRDKLTMTNMDAYALEAAIAGALGSAESTTSAEPVAAP